MKKTLFILLSALITVSAVFGQSINPKTGAIVPLDPKTVSGILPNGMKYYIRQNNVPEKRAEFYIVHNVGAILEEDNQNGLAHFTEHMAFNGTKNYPGKGILNFMEQNGVAFGHNVNAFTAQDVTCYNLSAVPVVRDGMIDSTLMILHDWSSFISFEPKEIDAERGVIHEEWRTRRNADFRLRNKTTAAIYNNSKYAKRDVIGDINVIDNFKHETIKQFYTDWYRPDLQALIIVGDIDPKKIEEKIKRLFADIAKRKNPKQVYSVEIPNNTEPLIAVASDPEAQQTTVQLFYKHDIVKVKDSKYYEIQWKTNLIATMMNNRLNELTQKENPPFIYAYNYYGNYIRTKDALISFAASKNSESARTLETLLVENERIKQHGFTQSELDRAVSELLRKTEQQFKEKDKSKSEDFVWQYFSYFLTNEPAPGIDYDYNFSKEFLPKVKLSEINLLAKERITDKNIVVTVTGPEKEGIIMPTVEEIKKILNNVKTMKVEAYKETVSTEALVENEPKASKLISEKTEDGITEWLFENGTKVIIKPTTFKDDEILMTSFSMGGSSTVSEDEVASAQLLTQIVSMSGIGKFSKIDLDKKLSGKVVSLDPDFSKNDQGFGGSCSPADFETLLQLNYLYYTNPRQDETAYNAYMERIKAYLANNSSNPASKFRDSVSYILSNYNSRRKPMNVDLLNQVSFEKIHKIYKEHFSNAYGTTFVFVGNINIQKEKNAISKYIGGLPSNPSVSTYKDENVRSPKGIVVKKLPMKMEVPKSTVAVSFSGDFTYNPTSIMELKALEYILSLRYIETIREQEGGSYGVSVRCSSEKFPIQRFSMNMYFDCDPEKAEKLTSIIYREIEKIQKEGPTAVDLQKTTEYFKKVREEKMKENEFWLENLIKKYYYGFDPTTPENFENILKSLTIEHLKKASVKFLDMKNHVEIISVPEK